MSTIKNRIYPIFFERSGPDLKLDKKEQYITDYNQWKVYDIQFISSNATPENIFNFSKFGQADDIRKNDWRD